MKKKMHRKNQLQRQGAVAGEGFHMEAGEDEPAVDPVVEREGRRGRGHRGPGRDLVQVLAEAAVERGVGERRVRPLLRGSAAGKRGAARSASAKASRRRCHVQWKRMSRHPPCRPAGRAGPPRSRPTTTSARVLPKVRWQACPPEHVLLVTDVCGEKRFVSTVRPGLT
mgnify:CR=1 FL=1